MEKAAASRLREAAIAVDNEVAAGIHFGDFSCNRDPFISGPIGRHVKRFSSHNPPDRWIEEDDVGVCPDGKPSFMGGEAEESGRR